MNQFNLPGTGYSLGFWFAQEGSIIGFVFIYATLDGMKGITWTQVAQYWVLITAYLIPALAISFKPTGKLLPQAGLGATLRADIAGSHGDYVSKKLNGLLEELGFAGYTATFVGSWDKVHVLLVALALMVGTAVPPHVIVRFLRFYTVKLVNAARWSAM